MPFLVDGTLGGTFPSWTTATRPASPAVGQMGYNTTTGLFDQYVAGAWQSVSIGTGAQPQLTKYTSGSGTYTTPTGAKYLTVQMVGGGGGGGGCGPTSGGALPGVAGGTTTFGTSLLTCAGGERGINGGLGSAGGLGGAVTLNSPAIGLAVVGNQGGTFTGGTYNATSVYMAGGFGGISPLGTAYSGGSNSLSGAGGAGGGSGGVAVVVGNGAGAGGYIQAIIPSPSATYSYAVGAGGTGGAAGTDGSVGYNGGAGLIVVTAYF